jgi:hypothetical protein
MRLSWLAERVSWRCAVTVLERQLDKIVLRAPADRVVSGGAAARTSTIHLSPSVDTINLRRLRGPGSTARNCLALGKRHI